MVSLGTLEAGGSGPVQPEPRHRLTDQSGMLTLLPPWLWGTPPTRDPLGPGKGWGLQAPAMQICDHPFPSPRLRQPRQPEKPSWGGLGGAQPAGPVFYGRPDPECDGPGAGLDRSRPGLLSPEEEQRLQLRGAPAEAGKPLTWRPGTGGLRRLLRVCLKKTSVDGPLSGSGEQASACHSCCGAGRRGGG